MKVIINLDDIPFHSFNEILLFDDTVIVKGILDSDYGCETVEYKLKLKNRVSFENIEENRADFYK